MRKRNRDASRAVRRFPLPPDLREQMKKELRKVVGRFAGERGEARRACKVAVARARRERDQRLGKLDAELRRERGTIRADYEKRAAERLAEGG